MPITSLFYVHKPGKKIVDKVSKRLLSPGKFLRGLLSYSNRHSARFESPEYDLFTIRNALNEESLFRRAVDKYQEKIWKNGWKFVGKNPKTLDWVKKCFREMEVVSGVSTQELFERVSRQLIIYSNSFIVKVRNRNATSAMPYVTFDGKLRLPVAAYFVEPIEYLQIARDEKGNIKEYRLGTDVNKKWKPYNAIHITLHKHEGYAFGCPMAVPILDDILSLRQVEENMQIMVYQHAIPLYHFAVGSDIADGTEEEILSLNAALENMPSYGSLTTTNRVEINVLGVNKESMDLVPILEYWTSRILGGFGMSSVAFGDPDTANRGTATTVIKEFQTTTAMFQKAIKHAVEFHMIREMLEEAGYKYLDLTEEDWVELYMPEVDLDEQIKRENQEIFKYEHSSVTEDEMRIGIGMDPIPDSERKKMLLWLNKIPLALVGAMDESLADYPNPLGIGSSETNNKVKPRNQYGTKLSKSQPAND